MGLRAAGDGPENQGKIATQRNPTLIWDCLMEKLGDGQENCGSPPPGWGWRWFWLVPAILKRKETFVQLAELLCRAGHLSE